MKFIVSLLFAMFINVATAKEYVLINPNAPGSSSEVTARAIAEAYTRQTGNTQKKSMKKKKMYNMGEKYFGNRVTHIFPLKINIKGKIPY